MTGKNDFARTLAGWFEAEAMSEPAGGSLARALDATRRRRPRPAWFAGLGSHWVGEAQVGDSILSRPLLSGLGSRWATLLALLLLIVALVGGAILIGARLLQPQPAGRLGHLAYVLDANIYVADWDGRNPVLIAGSPQHPTDCGSAGSPTWSPDGRYIAYREGGAFCSSRTVVVSDPAGKVVAALPGAGWDIAWSPDSTRIATWTDAADSRTIAVYGLDGIREELLTLPAGFGPCREEDPYWSTDGASVLISLRLQPCTDPRQVWELPLAGSAPRIVPAEDPGSHDHATYSADRARVTYLDGEEFSTQSLVVAAVDGSQSRVLTSRQFSALSPRACSDCIPYGWMFFPVMSPTGDLIAVEVEAGQIPDRDPLTGERITDSAEWNDLVLIDVATGEETTLIEGSQTDPSHVVIEFSPDGDLILFVREDASGAGSLFSIRTDGFDARQLVAGTITADWQGLPGDSR